MADILRVHDWSYVRSIQHLCASIPDVPSVVGHLDGDTAIAHGTFKAAQVAVGGICRAVDQVVTGQVSVMTLPQSSIDCSISDDHSPKQMHFVKSCRICSSSLEHIIVSAVPAVVFPSNSSSALYGCTE